MVKVKICGITSLRDAEGAVSFGADALGFVFYPKSPRHITPEDAGDIIRALPPFITTVGVFVDEDPQRVREVMDLSGLDIAQFHGNEPPEDCKRVRRAIKALRVREMQDINAMKAYDVSAFLLDTYTPEAPGGTGRKFDWEIARKAVSMRRIILAGGLDPENVAEAVRSVRPYAVDVSSGVEISKGVKDHRKLEEFIKRAKDASL